MANLESHLSDSLIDLSLEDHTSTNEKSDDDIGFSLEDHTLTNDDEGIDLSFEHPNLQIPERLLVRMREINKKRDDLLILRTKFEMLNMSSDYSLTESSNESEIRHAYNQIQDKFEVDGRSVIVGNIHPGSSAHDLEEYFKSCGAINQTTILYNNGGPNGYKFALIEFTDMDSHVVASAMDGTIFHGRPIEVRPKRIIQPTLRTNIYPFPNIANMIRPFQLDMPRFQDRSMLRNGSESSVHGKYVPRRGYFPRGIYNPY